MKLIKKLKALLYVVRSAFLGIFGFANLAPNSTVGQMTGQSVSPSNADVTSSKKQAPEKTKTQKEAKATRRDSGDGGVVPKKPVVWKPGKQMRKKKSNMLHVKAGAKRKHRRKKKGSKR